MEIKRKQDKQRQRKEANELVTKSKANSFGKEEDADLPSISRSSSKSKSDDKEKTPQQLDSVEELESPPPFWIQRPVTYSTSKATKGHTVQSKTKTKIKGEV